MYEIIYEGKSKTVCTGRDNETYLIRYKDTVTAFNGEKQAEFSGKGKINASVSRLIYGFLEENSVKTHLLEIVDETAEIVKRAEIVPVEVVIRNVAAGSFSKKYGVSEGSALLNTVVEFSLKSDKLGDPMMSESHITALGLATKKELDEMTALSLKINGLLTSLFEKAGITLVDFKLEFGRCDKELILCDEISPDSCRLWDTQTCEKLDKDRFRRDLGDILVGYGDVLRRLQNVR